MTAIGIPAGYQHGRRSIGEAAIPSRSTTTQCSYRIPGLRRSRQPLLFHCLLLLKCSRSKLSFHLQWRIFGSLLPYFRNRAQNWAHSEVGKGLFTRSRKEWLLRVGLEPTTLRLTVGAPDLVPSRMATYDVEKKDRESLLIQYQLSSFCIEVGTKKGTIS